MIKQSIKNIKEKNPLIHCITNYVTVNDVANIIIAYNGSPIMSDEETEVEEITSICDGLLINIGTLNKSTIKSMFKAGKYANKLKKPIVLDPVGVGASKLRTETAKKLIKKLKIDVIKGNISEIKVLANENTITKGVDANILDIVNEKNLDESVEFVKKVAKKFECIIIVTGKIDLVTDGNKCYIIKNGHENMSKITGTGCQMLGLLAVALASNPQSMLEACVTSVCIMGVAGEIASNNLLTTEGNISYRNKIIDTIFKIMNDNNIFESFERMIKCEVR